MQILNSAIPQNFLFPDLDTSEIHEPAFVFTQVGLVQFVNFTVADNGAGPRQHVVNGKEHGGGIEFSQIADLRRRSDTPVEEMAGIIGAKVIAKTTEGFVGTAAYWPKQSRGIRGVLTQSAP